MAKMRTDKPLVEIEALNIAPTSLYCAFKQGILTRICGDNGGYEKASSLMRSGLRLFVCTSLSRVAEFLCKLFHNEDRVVARYC